MIRTYLFLFLFSLASSLAYATIDPEPEPTAEELAAQQNTIKAAHALLTQGIDLYTNERYEQAKTLLKEALKHVDDNTIIHLFLAQSYDKLGETLNAKTHYNRALDLEPANFFATMGLAKLYFKEKNYDAAMLLYDEVLEYKDVARVYVAKANVYFMKQDYARAMKLYQKAISKDMSYSPAYFNLGNIYLFMGEYEHALRNYKNAVKYNPESMNGHLYLALVYNYLDQREKALKHFNITKELFEEAGILEPVESLDELMEKAFSDIKLENAF